MDYRQQCILEAAAALLCRYHRFGVDSFIKGLSDLLDDISTDDLDSITDVLYSAIPLTAHEAVNRYIRYANNRG